MNINKYLQPGESVNVIASAGTGKTWFIISKILRILLDDVAPEKITAITFTRKTTAEMQTRLNDKIEYWASSTEQEILFNTSGLVGEEVLPPQNEYALR